MYQSRLAYIMFAFLFSHADVEWTEADRGLNNFATNRRRTASVNMGSDWSCCRQRYPNYGKIIGRAARVALTA
jgi:hypothetical protein